MKEATPREKRHARTRQAIVEAAWQLVAEYGSEGFSMRMLAESIEYSPAGLYEYFSSKDEILATLSERGFATLSAALARVPKTLSSSEQLVRRSLVYIDFALRNQQIYLLMFGRVKNVFYPLHEAHENIAFQQLKQVIAEGIASGNFHAHEGYGAGEIAYHFWTLMHGIAMLRLTFFRESKEDIDALNRTVFEEAVTQLGKA